MDMVALGSGTELGTIIPVSLMLSTHSVKQPHHSPSGQATHQFPLQMNTHRNADGRLLHQTSVRLKKKAAL